MNRLFLLLGSLLLLTLTAALVAPRFIDWGNYTDLIEEQASRMLGRDVHVSGAVDLRLLPMPRLTFSDVEIASREDGALPEVSVVQMQALMSLAPFLSGEAEIVELILDRPVLRLSALDEDEGLLDDDGFDPGSIAIEEARILNGRVERIAPDGSTQVLVDGLNATLNAPSLFGPWRVDPASAIINGERVTMRVQSGVYGGDRRMRMRLTVLPVQRAMEFTIDGFFDWSQADAHFEGQARAESLVLAGEEVVDTLTWQVTADIDAALGTISAENIEANFGQGGDQAFVLAGMAQVNLGDSPAFSAELSSRQVDLDRMLGGGAAAPIDLTSGWNAAGELLRWIEQVPVPGAMSFDIPAIVIGGSVIREIGFEATYRPGLPVSLDDLVATFPGDTDFGFSGAVAPAIDAGLMLDGVMTLESVAPDLFVGWSTGRRDESDTFSQLSSIEMSARVVAEPGRVGLERLRGMIDGSALSGAITYDAGLNEAVGGRLDVDLSAGRFDFGLLAGLGRWLTQSEAVEGQGGLISTVNADLLVDELVAGAENLGEVAVSVAVTQDTLRIDQLTIGNAAGARVTATGFLDRQVMPPTGVLSVDANMDELDGLVRLVRDVLGDSPLLVDLARNTGLYEPVAVTGTYSHDGQNGLRVGLTGTVGGADIDLTGDMPLIDGEAALPDGLGSLFDRPTEFRLDVTSPDAFALIGQLGLPALPIDTDGGGNLLVSLASDGITDPRVRFAFDGLETSLRLDAGLAGDAETGVTGLAGTGSIFVGNVAQTGFLAGMALPGLFDPISASAGFDVTYDHDAQEAVLSAFTGEFADVPLAGQVIVSRDPLGMHIDAELEADRLDLRGVLAGFVGPGTFDLGFSNLWPEGPLAFNPVPVNLDLQLSAPRMVIWDNVTAFGAQLSLQAREGEVVLDQIGGQLYGGTLDGRLVMRDADRGTIATGRLALSDLDLGQLAWERSGQAVMQGAFSTSLSFETSGGSMSSLMSALTGDGTFALSDVTVSGLGLDGFSRILQASDAGLLGEEDDIESAFSDAMSAGTMRIAAADSPISMVGGVARASNLYIEGQSTALRGGLTLDFSTGLVDANFSYSAIEGPGDVESMPNVGLSFVGPLAAPERMLDVSQIDGFLNVRQLELEIRRVETLNAEILERERLLRTMAAIDLDLTRLEAERQETERLQAERLEAERVAAEARRAAEIEAEAEAVEEQQLRALEQQRAEEALRAGEAAGIERERALREALQAREADQVLNLDVPSLSEPITVNGLIVRSVDPLAIGQNPPPATSAPLDLSPN